MNDIYKSHMERHSSCLLLNTYIKAENQLVKRSVCVSGRWLQSCCVMGFGTCLLGFYRTYV